MTNVHSEPFWRQGQPASSGSLLFHSTVLPHTHISITASVALYQFVCLSVCRMIHAKVTHCTLEWKSPASPSINRDSTPTQDRREQWKRMRNLHAHWYAKMHQTQPVRQGADQWVRQIITEQKICRCMLINEWLRELLPSAGLGSWEMGKERENTFWVV